MPEQLSLLEEQLNDFDSQVRRSALEQLKQLADAGAVPVAPPTGNLNLHCHTLFSFNGYGYSPSRFIWEAYKHGLEAAGIVDFDVLDGVAETLGAGDLLGVKAVAGIETRVFIREYRDKVINSPKEPGVYYFMGSGFVTPPPPGTESARMLQSMSALARSRNEAMLGKINAYLRTVQIDYEEDVLPLTPKGNATERHMLEAYDRKARAVHGEGSPDLIEFWAAALDAEPSEVTELLKDRPSFQEKSRAKLMKFGGVGYAAPEQDSFPALEAVIDMCVEAGALPTGTWLDGTSEGEQEIGQLLEFLIERGVVALNIIPDRNWRVKEPEEKALKVGKLREVIEASRQLHLPLVVGTEMNKYGQLFVDDFAVDELREFTGDFRAGAHFVYGHTVLARAGQLGYQSDWAATCFGDNRSARNEFCRRVGERAFVGPEKRAGLPTLGESSDPEAILRALSD